MLLAPFSSCCCYEFWLPLHPVPNGKTPWKKSPPGGETPCLWRMMLLAPFSSCCCYEFWLPLHPVPKWENKKITSRGRNTMPLKDGEAPKLQMPNVTSETHRKWCFWLLFPLAAAMNFSYLYIRSPNGKTPWKKSPPGGETPCLWRTEKPQNTSISSEKWCDAFGSFFLLLLLWILATFTSGPQMEKHHGKNHLPGRNTMPLKDGEAPKLHPENA